MTSYQLLATFLMVLAPSISAMAQSPADLLQKGIYARETAGDLDAAIKIFRQVATSPDKNLAAQAHYQLVLCMLERGDSAAASREIETLARNFPEQTELVAKARGLLPSGSSAIQAPWGDGETSQLNIKRDGVATGSYLTYSIDPARELLPPDPNFLGTNPIPNQQSLRWELVTKKSIRSVLVNVDRNTGQPVGQPVLSSNDVTGDWDANPLAGPAIDIQQSVFALRRLPLAVGYQRAIDTLPFILESPVAKQVTFKVTAIEPVEVTAGRFKCYKVSFGSLDQTFWIGIEGSRPLVKIKAGNVEADLVKIWAPENFIDAELGFFRDAGWRIDREVMGPGPRGRAELSLGQGQSEIRLSVWVTKVYTPAAEIPRELQAALHRFGCDPATIENRVIGEQSAVSCIDSAGVYRVFIRSETAFIEPSGAGNATNAMGVYRWQVDHALATAKRIP